MLGLRDQVQLYTIGMSFGNNLSVARQRANLTQAQLGEAVGVTSQAVSQWERGETTPELPKILPLARRLDVPESWLLSENARIEDLDPAEAAPPEQPAKLKTQVVGYVGAGAKAHYYAVAQGELEEVDAPANSTEKTVAVEIRGNSLGSALDRALAFYDAVRRPITPDLVGRVCVVGLDDDRVLIKRVRLGSKAGLFRLTSENEKDIVDVPILWAALVKTIVPR